MKASVYYTLTAREPCDLPAFTAADRARLSALFKLLQDDGNKLQGVYITDRTAPLCKSLSRLVRHDAAQHCFDLLYLYLYNTPLAIPAEKLSDILDLPIDGRASVSD